MTNLHIYDIICLIIRDDSVLQDVLEFVEKIASLNKPIIVLLNHMENITSTSSKFNVPDARW